MKEEDRLTVAAISSTLDTHKITLTTGYGYGFYKNTRSERRGCIKMVAVVHFTQDIEKAWSLDEKAGYGVEVPRLTGLSVPYLEGLEDGFEEFATWYSRYRNDPDYAMGVEDGRRARVLAP